MDEIFIKTSSYDCLEKHFKDRDLTTIEELIGLIEDLDYDLENLKEEFDDFKNEVKEHYKPIPFDPYDEYGISESDFH